MTDLWKFSETPLSGGSSNEESSLVEESIITGGMSVSDFFCRNRPESDNQRFTLFDNLTVPFGLVYLPPCNDSNDYNEIEESDEPKNSCENFETLFSSSFTTLGKKESNRRTRKKIAS
jgi:hypothetical protein